MGNNLSELKTDKLSKKDCTQNVYMILGMDNYFRTLPEIGNAYSYPLLDVQKSKRDKSFSYYPQIKTHTEINPLEDLTEESLVRKIFFLLPMLDYMNFKNLAIAGPSLANILCNKKTDNYEFYIYGIDTAKKVENKIESILESIKTWASETERCFRIIKTPNELSINIIKWYNIEYTITIKSRLYKNIKELLYSFEHGTEAIAFDGNTLFFSLIAQYCYTNKCIIANTYRRSKNFENTLIKYITYGFTCIVPFMIQSIKRHTTTLFEREKYSPNSLEYIACSLVGHSPYISKLLEYNPKPKKLYKDSYKPYLSSFVNELLLSDKANNSYIYVNESKDALDITVGVKKTITKYLNNNEKDDSVINMNEFRMRCLFGDDYKHISFEDCHKKIDDIADNIYTKIKEKNTKDNKLFAKMNWIIHKNDTLLTNSSEPIISPAEDWYGQYFDKDIFQYYLNLQKDGKHKPRETIINFEDIEVEELDELTEFGLGDDDPDEPLVSIDNILES